MPRPDLNQRFYCNEESVTFVRRIPIDGYAHFTAPIRFGIRTNRQIERAPEPGHLELLLSRLLTHSYYWY